jgi:hypothetical protein
MLESAKRAQTRPANQRKREAQSQFHLGPEHQMISTYIFEVEEPKICYD